MRRQWFILFAALSAATLLCGMGKSPTAEEVPRITLEDLKAELGSPDLVVIDVRTDKDWKESDRKIAGAFREDSSTPQKWAGNYAKEKKIVLYCA